MPDLPYGDLLYIGLALMAVFVPLGLVGLIVTHVARRRERRPRCNQP